MELQKDQSYIEFKAAKAITCASTTKTKTNMNEENQSKLDNLLAKTKARNEKYQADVESQKDQQDTFLNDFQEFAEGTIKSIMLEIGSTLKTNGHDFKVVYEAKQTDNDGRSIDARIMMEIYPEGKGRGDMWNKAAHILFYADEFKKSIGVHENNITPNGGGGSAGRRTYEYSISNLTKQKIEKEIIESLENIL